ncbi:MAG: SAM-dependent methyltransferase [Paenibacillaceae bacterium]|jgi:2-polyprenyl-6-hydroxyphenyl methylase/3-demethylubiquinone-9 3-methyltransferase|nr:SAM-dependent methyltransferase [Paenibacillaceae bacterium]
MPNDDRVNERYYGLINSLESHQSTRMRIHWICRQTTGKKILDAGCSQGITTILLAREGFEVTGIDLDEASLAYAIQEVKKESAPVRKNVTFFLTNVLEINPAMVFDTVILGEILEHFSHPLQLLEKVHSLLPEGGRIIITVPYGFHPFHDHKQTFYCSNLYLMLEPFYEQLEMEIHHKYLFCTGKKREAPAAPLSRNEQMERWMLLDCGKFAEMEGQHFKALTERKKNAGVKSASETDGSGSL